MKKIVITLLTTIYLCNTAFADIAPNPIVVKSVFTTDSCKIRMLSEIVIANLYRDSAKVECVFELVNYGGSITIEIGFPEMNFQYWSIVHVLDDHYRKQSLFHGYSHLPHLPFLKAKACILSIHQ